MQYTIEIYNAGGLRIARYDEVPLLEATRNAPDQPDTVRGVLPAGIAALGQAYRVRVCVEGELFCDARIRKTSPQWSDAVKLILEQYVPFHEVMAFEAATDPADINRRVSQAYTNREIGAMVKDLVNRAPGPLHYWVEHTAFPDGAQREQAKFDARRTVENALEIGGIAEGQWVGAARIDLGGAYAKDGDTIAGIVVDGEAWPDLRLMMIDAEETSLNEHTVKRHPETADWDEDRYAASGYKLKAERAKAFLQGLIDAHGIDYIELNPHRNAAGAFDDRVDAFGRYLALVYGGGKCFNAALVEEGHADVYLYDEGRRLVPDLALKDFYSYNGAHRDSVAVTGVSMGEFDVTAGVLETVTALAYAAGGFVFDVDAESGLAFRRADAIDRMIDFDPLAMGVEFGERDAETANLLYVSGNPFHGLVNFVAARGESIDAFGLIDARFAYFSVAQPDDAERLAEGMLDDMAYPEPAGGVRYFRGKGGLRVGEIVELRDGPLRRMDPALPGAYAGRFGQRLVARINRVRHRFSGPYAESWIEFTSPFRSVSEPRGYIVRSQPGPTTLFEFRLDDATVGLDMGFHLD